MDPRKSSCGPLRVYGPPQLGTTALEFLVNDDTAHIYLPKLYCLTLVQRLNRVLVWKAQNLTTLKF